MKYSRSKSKRNSHLFLTLFFGISLVVTIFWLANYLSNRNTLADVRLRATCTCSGGACPDGWSYGTGECQPYPNCETRHKALCESHGTLATGTQPGVPVSCASGWTCGQVCAQKSIVDQYSKTWCYGKAQWQFEVGRNLNINCGGEKSKPKSEGCT